MSVTENNTRQSLAGRSNYRGGINMSKKLVAYYSRADENYFGGGLKVLAEGNTKKVAKFIAAATGADLFEIEQTEPYSANYQKCTEEAKADKMANARPALTHYLDSLAEYDTIYLGYPNYWATMPMAVWTFLERYDLTGKTIHPFCTHEGSAMGESVRDLKKLAPGATVSEGLAIYGSSAPQSENAVKSWLAKL